MKYGESINDHFGRVMTIANDMQKYGEDVTNVKIIEKILGSLTGNCNYIVCSIEEDNNVNGLTVNALQSSLLVHGKSSRGNQSR